MLKNKQTSTQPFITYTGMIWLLAAQLIVMLPFTTSLPPWLLAVVVLAAGWRLRVLAGKASQPKTLLKAGLLLLGIAAVFLSGLRLPSLEAMSALLLLGFAFKAVEAVQQRDALVVILTGYFLVALHFLYTQSIIAGLYGTLALIVLTGALVGVQQTLEELTPAQQVQFNFWIAGQILLQCLPLMVIIFVLTPRFQPFWSLPLPTEQHTRGILDRMAPGDIEKLSQSADLAFRVSFKTERPPQTELYWQGLVLQHFDGREWRQFATEQDPEQLKWTLKHEYSYQEHNLKTQGMAYEYEAIYEPSGQNWLFTLSPTTEVQGEVLRAADYRVMAKQPLQSPLLIRAVSRPASIRDLELSPKLRALALQLPSQGDNRSRELAKNLYAAAGDELTYIQTILKRFKEQAFFYTLNPPLLGETDTIDGFLFDSQRGFCSHYAGSFVFLMRAVGIPARVVVGYQGGEWNKAGNYLAVHQFDAHAWAEVWLPNQGWLRVDPTSMVAPERTEQNLEAALKKEGRLLEQSVFSSRKFAWLNSIRQQLDRMQYGWQRWILSYDSATQAQFLDKLLGGLSVLKLAGWALALLVCLALSGLIWLGLTRQAHAEALEHRLYRRFTERLSKQGFERRLDQTPSEFGALAAQAWPAQAEKILAFTATYQTLCYECDEPQAKQRSSLLRELRRLLSQLP
ncbi:transglutaminase TgpA family protein [Thiothrix eikelboomii]|uniref:transglutaminase TgpA family protein n=1 Tax=Thiothrix eikelboomii TaxID=92487 RepID=UPI003BAF19A8